ncbi:hypothetical protein M5689_001028 [Euphorbia peplus]|nr:hypothetical protein M5689_001028 [Euphorbia peplus]
MASTSVEGTASSPRRENMALNIPKNLKFLTVNLGSSRRAADVDSPETLKDKLSSDGLQVQEERKRRRSGSKGEDASMEIDLNADVQNPQVSPSKNASQSTRTKTVTDPKNGTKAGSGHRACPSK